MQLKQINIHNVSITSLGAAEFKDPANQVPTHGGTCGRAFQGDVPQWGMYNKKPRSTSIFWLTWRA